MKAIKQTKGGYKMNSKQLSKDIKILNNYLNGNITDAKKELKTLTKRALIDFIRLVNTEYTSEGYLDGLTIAETLLND